MPLSKKLIKTLREASKKAAAKSKATQEERTVPLKEEESKLPEFQREENIAEYEEGQLSVDVFQTADEIVVIAPVAGVNKKDVQVSITDEVLTIRGKRHFVFEVANDQYYTRECFWGNFSRSIVLPDSIDAAKVRASFKDGILTVRIPKVEKIRTRTIEIREE